MENQSHKIYVFNNGGQRDFLQAIAIADDGHCLAGHICSHESFMAHDMGITSKWKHEQYNEHFGEGNWEIEWVSSPKNHAGLNSALGLNAQLAAKESSALEGAEELRGSETYPERVLNQTHSTSLLL